MPDFFLPAPARPGSQGKDVMEYRRIFGRVTLARTTLNCVLLFLPGKEDGYSVWWADEKKEKEGHWEK